ncbi:MAG: hypothetical protein FWG20_06030 [Candidatus Cloacimonetes bacterium]|nr:hypothetical protein [Candidatus Cloacimonadota bacterium]
MLKVSVVRVRLLFLCIILITLLINSCEKQEVNPIFDDTNTYRYYYETHLNEKQKEIYRIVLAGVLRLKTDFEVPFSSIEEYSSIFNYIRQDNPILFYVSNFTLKTYSNKKKCVFVPKYLHDKAYIIRRMQDIEEYLFQFEIAKNMSDLDKELYVYKFFTDSYVYDKRFRDSSYNILGPVMYKTAVCDGIAKSIKLVFDHIGLKCIYVTGKMINPPPEANTDGHAWNIVFIDDKAYHLDVTWDLPEQGKKAEYYTNLNLTDSEVKRTRIIESKTPPCTVTGLDYFTINGLVVNNLNEFSLFIYRRLVNRERRIVVRFLNMSFSKPFYDSMVDISRQQYLEVYNSVAAINTVYDEALMIFELIFETQGTDYSTKNIQVVSSINEYRNYVDQCLRKKQNSIVVRFRNMQYSDRLYKQIQDIAMDKYIEINKKGVSLNIQYFKDEMIFELELRQSR